MWLGNHICTCMSHRHFEIRITTKPFICNMPSVSFLIHSVAVEGWKKQSSDNHCCCCHGYGVTFLVSFVIFLLWGFPSLSCFGGHRLVLLVDNIVDFSLWRELLASCHGGSHCLRTVEEVMSLTLWKKSLPLHLGGYHWPCAMEAGSRWPCTLEVAVGLALWRQPLDSHFREPLALLSSAWGSTGLAVDWHIFLKHIRWQVVFSCVLATISHCIESCCSCFKL